MKSNQLASAKAGTSISVEMTRAIFLFPIFVVNRMFQLFREVSQAFGRIPAVDHHRLLETLRARGTADPVAEVKQTQSAVRNVLRDKMGGWVTARKFCASRLAIHRTCRSFPLTMAASPAILRCHSHPSYRPSQAPVTCVNAFGQMRAAKVLNRDYVSM